MELPEGVYLVSNVYEDNNTPAYADEVPPLFKREEQWKKMLNHMQIKDYATFLRLKRIIWAGLKQYDDENKWSDM